MLGLLKAALLVAPVLAIAGTVELGKPNVVPLQAQEFVTLRMPEGSRELSLRVSVLESTTVCGYPNIAINGQPLPPGGKGTFAFDRGQTVSSSWVYGCLNPDPEEGYMTATMVIEKVNGEPVVGLSLTVTFRQVEPLWVMVGHSDSVSSVYTDASGTESDAVKMLEAPEIPSMPHVPDTAVAPATPVSDVPDKDDTPDALDFELARLDFLHMRLARLEKSIADQEQRLADEFGWLSPQDFSDCRGFMCLVGSIVDKVSDAALAIYDGVVGDDESKAAGHRKGRRPKHGKPGRRPHCPGKWPHHGWPHHGNHTHGNHTHGNHTFPHPPFPPPGFCRCPPPPPPPPPHHGPPPGHPPPPPPPPPPPHHGPPPGHPPPPPPPHHGPPPGHPPPPPPPPHHGPPPGHPPPPRPAAACPLKLTGAFILAIIAFALVKRCHSKFAFCLARRRRRTERKQFVKRVFSGAWLNRTSRRASKEEDETASMLREHEKETSITEELAGCRAAADMVGDMVAAEEGRAKRETQKKGVDVHVAVGGMLVSVADGTDDEVLPPYDERSLSSDGVADGLRYTPGSSAYTPSSNGSDDGFENVKV